MSDGVSRLMNILGLPNPPIRAPEGWIGVREALERIPKMSKYAPVIRALREDLKVVHERLISKLDVAKAEGAVKIDVGPERAATLEVFIQLAALLHEVEDCDCCREERNK